MKPDATRRKKTLDRPPEIARVRVTYSDTDQMGHVYYANYLVWFEIGRNEFLRSMGQLYRNWEEERGVFLPVTSCWIDYAASAHYDDMVRIETSVTHITRASITFEYKLYLDGTDQLLASGGTRHAFVWRDGRIARVADQLVPQLFSTTNSTD